MAAAAMTPRWSETALSPASFPGVSFSIDSLPLIRFFLGSEGHSTTGSAGLAVTGWSEEGRGFCRSDPERRRLVADSLLFIAVGRFVPWVGVVFFLVLFVIFFVDGVPGEEEFGFFFE